MSFSYNELKNTPDSEIIRLHDESAKNTCVGIRHYLDELHRREQDKNTQIMVDCTVKIKQMTVVMLLFTAIMIIGMFFK